LDKIVGARTVDVNFEQLLKARITLCEDVLIDLEHLRDLFRRSGHLVNDARIVHARRDQTVFVVAARDLHLARIFEEDFRIFDNLRRNALRDPCALQELKVLIEGPFPVWHRIPQKKAPNATDITIIFAPKLITDHRTQRRFRKQVIRRHATSCRIFASAVVRAIEAPFGTIVDYTALDHIAIATQMFAFEHNHVVAVTLFAASIIL
jgi:hypothetical protein